MRREYPDLQQRGIEVLSIGPDSAKAFREYWDEHNIPFPGLADPKSRVAKLYAQPIRLLKLGRMPMQLVVDKEGVIVYRHEGGSMKDIPATEDGLAKLSG